MPTSLTSQAVARLDRAVDDLQAHKTHWAKRPIRARIRDLERVIVNTEAEATAWVAAAVRAKGISVGSPLEGEEWISGPWALVTGAAAYVDTLRALAEGRSPLERTRLRTSRSGQVVVDAFPFTPFDRLLLSGYSAEVWMQPDVSVTDLEDQVAQQYKDPAPMGRVALVLGAGNITSIAPLDVLHELFVENSVAVVKLNPVNDYLGPHLERIFEPLVTAGFVRFAYGGADVGGHLVRHDDIEAVHITGSVSTHDAIVFGERTPTRSRRRKPLLDKPITSELGGVGAAIVVPGPWDRHDLRHHATNLATMKLHNAGFNCIALQVLVLPRQWPLADVLVDQACATIRACPPRPPYYPGAAHRRELLVAAHPDAEALDDTEVPTTLIRDLDPRSDDEPCFTTEAFGGVFATTKLPGDDAASFLAEAVKFCNDVLSGTLGVNVLIHPKTKAALGRRFDEAIAQLRYGTIGINCWKGLSYLLQRTPWGAFPGHTLDDIQSGIGTTHNGLMLANTQKTVVRGPFRTFPRSLRHGERHLATKPPWFVTHRRAHVLGERLTRFAGHPSWLRVPALLPPALQG